MFKKQVIKKQMELGKKVRESSEQIKKDYNNGAPIYELAAKYDIPELIIRNLLGKKD